MIKFAFFGTPKIAAITLEILEEKGFLPSLIVTAPDKPVGRKQIVTPPPVKVWAEKNNIPVLQPEKFTGGERSPDSSRLNLKNSKRFNLFPSGREPFDLSIVVAYGKIFPEWLINAPKLDTLNIHYSLLPKYRGASPVQSAILNGEKETGVTIQKMVKELDAGPIVAQEKVKIRPDEKAPELLERLTKVGGNLLAKILPEYVAGKIKLVEQDDSKAIFCGKIKKEDGLIDLNDDSIKNYNKFRAFYGWPRTYFFKENKRNIITDATLENRKFIIKKVIPEGGKETVYR